MKGSQQAVWFYSDIRMMIWSKDVFKKAGLDPEKGPTTWDELFADAKAIKDKVPGVNPVEFPASSEESTVDRWYSYLYMTGSNILKENNTKAAFNDAGGQKALQLLRRPRQPGTRPEGRPQRDRRRHLPPRVLGKDRDHAGDGW